MKVTLEKDYRRYYTLEELDWAKAVIKAEKEDESTAKSWAEYAAREALRDEEASLVEVIRAEAETARNARVWEAYGEGTGNVDVWIRFLAETSRGFIQGGAYLTDIWGCNDYKNSMYIKVAEWKGYFKDEADAKDW